jgi:hypothetical protein
MRTVDLALYADALAGEAAALGARIERERGRLRQQSVERAARAELSEAAVERLVELGLLTTRGDPERLAALEESLDAVDVLQAWVEARLSLAESSDRLHDAARVMNHGAV